MLLILTLAAAVSSGDPTSTDLAALHRLYQESCAVRAYATYDEMCDQLRAQVRQAEAEVARDARRHASRSKPAAPAAKPDAGQTPAQPAPASFAAPPKTD